MKLITFPPSLAVLSNPVTSHTLMWPEYEYEICHGGFLIPLVVSPVNRNLVRAYLILDGNHRACLCAKHGISIPAYVMTRDTPPYEIFELEAKNQIRRFPHREFLCGDQTFRGHMNEAIEAALRLDETVEAALDRILRTE
jgi:hypothetical protein